MTRAEQRARREATIRKFLAAKETGLTQKAIGEAAGVSHQYVSQLIGVTHVTKRHKQNGTKHQRQRWTPERDAHVLELLGTGLSCSAVAKRLGIGRSAVVARSWRLRKMMTTDEMTVR